MNAKGPRAEALQHVFIINHEPVQVQVSEEPVTSSNLGEQSRFVDANN